MTAPSRRPRTTSKQPKPYHWFKGASVRALYDQIGAAGPDTARLEVRTDGDQMFFRVVAEGENGAKSAVSDIDDSFICPPICP